MTFPKAHKTVLPNGLRLVVVPMKDNPTITVQVLVETGSHYESKRLNGLSHFLEHMCFKGTTNRPSALAITHELDGMGAVNNAFTGNEVTGYWAKARAKYFEQTLDIVSDIYLNPLLPAAELEKERGVIIEEINMYEDAPQRISHELFEALLYKNQPAGRPIVGPKENIRRFTRNDFVSYRNTHYVAPKTVVVISGNINLARARALVTTYFKSLPKAPRVEKPPIRVAQRSPQLLLREKKTEQTHLVLGFHSYNTHDPRLAKGELAAAILGAGMSSRLFQRLREELGVAYYARSAHEDFADAGIFKIFAGVDNRRVPEVVRVIMEEVRRLREELIPEAELQKAKELIIGRLSMGLEGSDDMADWYGMQEIMRKKLETPEAFLRKIRSISAKDIRDYARDRFQDKHLNLALIGPKQDRATLKKLLSI